MSNTLKKITARAKQIHKAHPSKKWTDCIKQASRELKSGKRTTAKKSGTKKRKPANRQTGTSKTSADRRRKAKKPGKRLSASGKVYYERRRNRSDKPGALSGIKKIGSIKGGFKSMAELRKKSLSSGNHFFSPANMKFFSSKVETSLIAGRYFITSDRNHRNEKAFTIRMAKDDASILTVGSFGQFKTKEDAKNYLKKLIR